VPNEGSSANPVRALASEFEVEQELSDPELILAKLQNASGNERERLELKYAMCVSEQESRSTGKAEAASVASSSPSDWSCKLCTYINSPGALKCGMCQSPQNKTKHTSNFNSSERDPRDPELREAIRLSLLESQAAGDNEDAAICIDSSDDDVVCFDSYSASQVHVGPGQLLNNYTLKSIVQHKGVDWHSGHYITDIAIDSTNDLNRKQKQWKRFDDQFVQTISEDIALGKASQAHSYLFFYERKKQSFCEQPKLN